MGEDTAIGWTDHTFNPWWGCERVSPGCQNCYAEAFAKRTGHPVWGKSADRRRFGDAHWAEPLKWNRQAEEAGQPAFVFCASMADVFEDRLDHLADRVRLFDLIEATPWLTWQLLTKRPENVMRMVPGRWEVAGFPGNVWVGTTVEAQRRAGERIPHLLQVPAAVRFLSCEPLLGPVVLPPQSLVPDARVCRGTGPLTDKSRAALAQILRATGAALGWPGIDWVIAGGESGPRHRPLDLDHARALRDQVTAVGVAFWFKQVGGLHPKSGGDVLDGVAWHQRPPAHHPAGAPA